MANTELVKEHGCYQPTVGKYRTTRAREWRPSAHQRGHEFFWGPTLIDDGEIALLLDRKSLIRIDPHENVDTDPRALHRDGNGTGIHQRSAHDLQRAEVIGASAAGVGVLGVACLAGSLFAFGAAIGYGLSPTVGIGLVLVGLVAILIAVLLANRTTGSMRAPGG
jgi:hypothetical protein